MITRIHIQNYRSFVDAEVTLRPFSLVIGANGSGKTSFLRFVQLLSSQTSPHAVQVKDVHHRMHSLQGTWVSHVNRQDAYKGYEVEFRDGSIFKSTRTKGVKVFSEVPLKFSNEQLPVFSIVADKVSGVETTIPKPSVAHDGSGTTQVLDWLKNGDREDLFDRIEENFARYVPEVEKLSLRTAESGKKQIQVREKGVNTPLPASELSEGTRLILCILTIIHQENPPPVILLEDIDRGMHPRIFEQVVPLMRDIAEKHDINIIATTHNPFLVDCFEDDPEAVVIVEKKDGASTLSTLASRLEGLDYDKVDPDEMPLGNLWYSGLVGGVPLPGRRRNRREA